MDQKKEKKQNKKIIRKIIRYIGSYNYILAISLFLGLISTIINVYIPRLLAKIINAFSDGVIEVMNGQDININYYYIVKIVIIMLIMCIFGNLIQYFQNILMANISIKLTYKLREEMDKKISKLPISYFDKVSNGDVLSKLTNDVDTMTSMLTYVVTSTFTSIITIIGIIVIMYYVNWICATVVLTVVITSFFVMKLVVKRTQNFFKSQQNLIGEVNGYIDEIYSQHNIVRAFNNEKDSIKTFNDINEKLYLSSWKASFFSALLTPIMFFLGHINYMIVISLACVLTVKGMIRIGDISSFISYVKSLNQPVQQLANITSVFQSIVAAAERIFDFLEEPEEDEGKTEINLANNIKGDIRFENVSFGYKEDERVIKNISFSVKAGQKAAFVGATGSGKTTVIKLLMKFYDINDGKIYIDGIDINKISKHDLRNIFSMVLQDAWMFSGSIFDNIRYGNLEATDEEVKLAAKSTYVDHFIKTLPQGYETILNDEATNISQGEKQLITIARAMVTNPQVLILDEATSSVDIKTERYIQKAMDNLMEGRTSFIIAHRLSTIRNADIIFFMSGGEILESGSHDELMKKNGYYANMYNSQYQT